MSIDRNAAIIEPRKGKREELLDASCALVFSPQDVDLFIRCFTDCRRRSKIYLSDIYTGRYQDCPFTLVGPSLGAPQTVLILEKLIALGVRRVIAVGWCGSLQPSVRVGDVVLPTAAICEEGTSVHYPVSAGQPGPSRELFSSLGRVLRGAFPKVHEGRVWSTDAPYRETFGKVLEYQADNVLAVEMEASALFTVAHFRSIHLAVVLTVSDELSSLQWHHGFKNPMFRQTREKLPELVLEALCSSAAA